MLQGCHEDSFNPLDEASVLPILGNEQQLFTFSIIDDHFDACADLSWSVVAGSVGTGSSQRQGVVFFKQGKPISEPAPLMQEAVSAVTPVDESTVTVSYEILEGPRVTAQTTPGSATFGLDQDGSLVIVENMLPLSANEAGIQLDLSDL